ncbi:SAM-dependent methyltransferase [Nocardia sp. GAS34]|uniref:N-6 DNA methylase n=1 Tax=unclassified Nocardia TaxID=2637762 RepID=UPI003D200DCE
MPKPVSTVSAAELSRLAGVTRATVSNWRRRHSDFPKAVGGSEARPLFDLHQMQEWLAARDIRPADSPMAELRTMLRADVTPDDAFRFMQSLRRAEDGWVFDERDSASAEFATRAVPLVERVSAIDGARVAIDALAERALEDAVATGIYGTPERLTALMAELVSTPGETAVRSVLDPACGGGSLLSAAAEIGAVDLYGQDVVAVQVERARLAVHAETDLAPDVRLGDSLVADVFSDLRVDAVLSNPPYGQRDWGVGELAFDTRWEYGLPPRLESELAWVQHAVAHLRPGGTAVLLLPPAVASRPSGRKIRTNLVRSGVLRAVIGLAPGAAPPWHVGLQIWVLRSPHPDARPSDALLFVDSTRVPTEGEDRIAWDAVTDSVVRAWRTFDGGNDAVPELGIAAAVGLVDVLDDAVDLTPARYVHSSLDSGAVSDRVDAALAQLSASGDEFAAARAALAGWTGSPTKSWRHVTIADLVNHGQLQWIRAQQPSKEVSTSRDQRSVLTVSDVGAGKPPSGTMSTAQPAEQVEIELGDVLIPVMRSDRTGGRNVRVAGPNDVQAIRGPHLHTLRVDPERLDPWFVAGVLTGSDNVSATRTSTVRFDPSKLRIPVVSLPEQQRYGTLFQQLFQLRMAAARAAEAAENVADQMFTGLTVGVLVPADEITDPSARG